MQPDGAHCPVDYQADLILHRLLRHLTLVQLQALVTALDGVLAAGGYGEIGIVMEKSHTRRIRVTISQDITPQAKPDALPV